MGVDPITMAIAAQAGGQIIGGISGDRANARNQRAQSQWQNKIFGAGEALKGQEQSMSPEIQKLLDQLTGTGPEKFGGMGDIDINSLFKDSGFNAGNDALNQVLRGGTDKGADSYLRSMMEGGGLPFDTSDMFSKLGTMDEMNLTKSVAGLRGGAGSLGQRFGSALGDRESSMRSTDLATRGARNAGIQQGSYEAGAGRALGAAGQLNDNMLRLLGIQTQAGTALNAAGQNAAGIRLQAEQGNRQYGLDKYGANQSAAQARIQQILAGLGLGNQAAGQHNDFLARIFGTQAGGPSPGQSQGSNVPGAAADAASMFAMLQMYGKK